MPTVAIQFKASDLAFAEQMLAAVPNGAKTAIRSAINDTLKSERAEMVRDAKAEINLPASDVRDAIHITGRPTPYSLSGTLSVDYHGVRLDEFRPKPRVREGQKGGGISRVALTEKGPLAFPHGFAAPFATGHTGLTIRRGPKRPPTKGKYAGRVLKRGPRKGQLMLRQAVMDLRGPAVVAVYEQFPAILDKAQVDTADKFEARLLSKIDWLLSKNNVNFPAA